MNTANTIVIPPMESIFVLIRRERYRQDEKWGRRQGEWRSHPAVKLAVLTEEVGEVARAILERHPAGLQEELIHVATVCVAWLEALDLSEEWEIGDAG